VKSMIKFFRKIRKNMIKENKVSKYMLYAIGEIVLVVIGILIALSINNWNEGRKEMIEEQKLLVNLNKEFSKNLNRLEAVIKELDTLELTLTTTLNKVSKTPNLKLSVNQVDSLLFKSLSNPFWNPSEFVLRDLENSGRLRQLSNDSLKNLLYDYSMVSSVIRDRDEDANIAFNFLLLYFKENGSLRQMDRFGDVIKSITPLDYNHFKFFSNSVFESAIDDCLVYALHRKRRFKEAKAIIIKIIKESEY